MNTFKIKQGLDIKMEGKAATEIDGYEFSDKIALVPDNYLGLTLKPAVKQGDRVKAGGVVMFDKNFPELKIVAPKSGVIDEVARGNKRKLLYISILTDKKQEYEVFPTWNKIAGQARNDNGTTEREYLYAIILNAGFGALIRQRPYDIVAMPNRFPKAIFVSAFDTAPLAPDYNFVMKGQKSNLQAGLSALAKLTDGKVFYSVGKNTADELRTFKDVEINEFDGPHPAGNVSVQINRLAPINKGEVVWTMNIEDVALLGKFLLTGKTDFTKIIALAGEGFEKPSYISTVTGVQIADILHYNIYKGIKLRYIAGNPLTGEKVLENDFLSPFAPQITAIPEGDSTHELLGWIMPRFDSFSTTNLYFTKILQKICPKKRFSFDARILGGERAFIMSGEYEKVFPLDIMPEQLVKAMIVKNIDKMEQLGAYEVAPEDFALCEFVCTSKIPVQKIVRESLDYMRKELE
ncbi:MAG: Na(+)-translocating NADH-quinone reductase subunit A [Prevotellaceae bacterium]|jgi:Na+-transporting NADH:ubiquinone oxidoreductase subunit A|nr:Na(+)-translocating NADH-quinone reductase subunit A [Prevotellaceae bacterium]